MGPTCYTVTWYGRSCLARVSAAFTAKCRPPSVGETHSIGFSSGVVFMRGKRSLCRIFACEQSWRRASLHQRGLQDLSPPFIFSLNDEGTEGAAERGLGRKRSLSALPLLLRRPPSVLTPHSRQSDEGGEKRRASKKLFPMTSSPGERGWDKLCGRVRRRPL